VPGSAVPQEGAMSTPATFDDPATHHPDADGVLVDRIHRLEGEVAELRHTLSELAEIVVGDIRERREAAIAVSAPVSEVSIPPSLVPGGETTIQAVKSLRRPWLLFDLIREVGVTVKMYMDPRYRVRRGTQLMVPFILAVFVLNYLVFNHTILDIPVFKHIAEGLVEIILAVLLYKVLMREVARYRQVIAQFAMGGRARAVPAALFNYDPDGAAHSRVETP
jgi:hypothetical protein